MTVLINLEEAAALLAELNLPDEVDRLLGDPRYWQEAVCLALFERCDELAFTTPKQAPALAACAARLVDRVPAEHCQGGRVRVLKGKAYYVYGTAHRAVGELDTAEDAYILAASLLLPEGRVLDRAELSLRLAVLRAEQRRFGEAVPLANWAVHAWRVLSDDRHLLGRVLLVRGAIHSYASCTDAALADVSAALTHLDAERSPRLHYAAIHNLATALMKVARDARGLEAAAKHVRRARQLGSYGPDSLPGVKLCWLEGCLLRKLGAFDEAEERFRGALGHLERHGARVEMVLLELDMAELYHDQRRRRDLRLLTASMFPQFRLFRPFKDAYRSLIRFHDAVMSGSVTGELIAGVRQTIWDSVPLS